VYTYIHTYISAICNLQLNTDGTSAVYSIRSSAY